jgi:hypothetical protein
MKPADKVLKRAQQAARSAESWAELSNALFDPIDGLLTRAYPTPAQRRAFVKSPQYQRIRQLLREAIDRHGLVTGATPRKSGRFVVRLPQSLHVALEQEARREGVSLNQLVVAKLAAQLGRLVRKPEGA